MLEKLGQYKILDRIGAGGLGEVYRARDTRLGRTVAIERLAASVAGDPERRERFLRDARAASALSHPNIAALYEVGEDQGELFLAFEYVPGEPLRAVAGGRPLNARRAIDLAVQIADALAEAHAEGIVHRDINPDNIIVTPRGNAKILDFGLATWTAGGAAREHAAEAATMTSARAGTTPGTLAYMSPEQALGGEVDQRSDIFSLGVVLFEMLTGGLPFSGATSAALALQIVQAAAPAPSSLSRALPTLLDAIVLKALAKSLDARYETAARLAAELRSVAALLDVRGGTSEPAGTVRPYRSAHSHRSWRSASAGLLLAALAGAGLWLERAAIRTLWRRTLGPPPAPVIAVVPFETDSNLTFYADGLADDLMARLGQTPGLKVVGRSAARAYRGRPPRAVARELGAGVALTGSVRPSGETVGISLELIDPRDDTELWTGQFTRDVRDIFAVQVDVAEQIAQALRVKPQPTPSSTRAASRLVDRRAYELYLRGRQAAAERRVPDAIPFYRQAVAADAGLAEAFAGLAEALHLQDAAPGDEGARRRDELRSAADRAFQLDPDLAAANAAMGLASESLADTLKYLRRAIELDPSHAEPYRQIGDEVLDFDPDLAIGFYRRSLQIDPASESGRGNIAVALAILQRWDEAGREMDALSASPRAALMRARFDIIGNRIAPAVESLRATPAIRGGAPAWVTYAIGLRAEGRGDEAFQEASRLVRRFPTSCDGRALLAGLTLDRRQRDAAHRLADPMVRAGRADAASTADVRCAVLAAAAMKDGREASSMLVRIASSERLLRGWALGVSGITGRLMLQGRWYPWTAVAGDPAITEGRQALDAAYAREREVAKAALAGLP